MVVKIEALQIINELSLYLLSFFHEYIKFLILSLESLDIDLTVAFLLGRVFPRVKKGSPLSALSAYFLQVTEDTLNMAGRLRLQHQQKVKQDR